MERIGAPVAVLLIGLLVVAIFLLAVRFELAAIAERTVRFDRSTGQYIRCALAKDDGLQLHRGHNDCID